MRGIAERLSSQFQVLTLDDAKLTPNFIAHKREITQQPGARFAPVAFVTGKIDAVQERADFLAYFQALPVPVMVIIGENVPSKSREEMSSRWRKSYPLDNYGTYRGKPWLTDKSVKQKAQVQCP
jgi:hypothetical protein